MSTATILPLKYDSWCSFTALHEDIYEPVADSVLLHIDPSRGKSTLTRMTSTLCPSCATSMSKRTTQIGPNDYDLLNLCEACGFFRWSADSGLSEDIDLPYAKVFDSTSETLRLHSLEAAFRCAPNLNTNRNPSKLVGNVCAKLRELYACDVRHIATSDGSLTTELFAVISVAPFLIQVNTFEPRASFRELRIVKLLCGTTTDSSTYNLHASSQKVSSDPPSPGEVRYLQDSQYTLPASLYNEVMSMVDAVRPNDAPLPWEIHYQQHPMRDRKKRCPPAGWSYFSALDGDIISGEIDGLKVHFAWQLGELDACYKIDVDPRLGTKIDSSSLKALCDTSRNHHVAISELRTNRYLSEIEVIPGDILGMLGDRWLSAYAEDVTEYWHDLGRVKCMTDR
jgi:hypothetical protein